MSHVKLEILGCGSALPRSDRFHSSQLLDMRNKQFLIDCGEAAQIRMRQYRFRSNRLNHIFISHLHGDHCIGLPGLISSLGMLGRTADIEIHAHPDLERIMGPMLNYFTQEFSFDVKFHPFSPYQKEVIYDDRSVKVTTIPLKHRVPTAGFLFEEKPSERHIIRDMIDAYEVPVSWMQRLKRGDDFVTPEGEVVANNRLTTDATPPKRYAYVSDTKYLPKIVEQIKGVDCLYHEATFMDAEEKRAKLTNHSTARQAAMIAKEAGVKKLVLGHYSARYDDLKKIQKEAQEVFEAVEIAKDGKVFRF